MPYKLRALHYQIMGLNHEMFELKKVNQELARCREEFSLNEFLKQNPEFRRISPRDEDSRIRCDISCLNCSSA